MTKSMPQIAVTLGDPSGIGPEVVLGSLKKLTESAPEDVRWVLVGDRFIAERAAETVGWAVEIPEMGETQPPTPVVLHDTRGLRPAEFRPSAVSKHSGEAAYAAMEAAVRLAADGSVTGIVTGPVSKEAIRLSRADFVDQATYFATAFGQDPESPVTMVIGGGYRCFLATKHIPLARVAAELSVERIAHVLRLADAALRSLGVAAPRMAVASLNPHVGEGGLLGTEEIDVIAPAIARVITENGLSADLMTGKAGYQAVMKGTHDGVVGMYHDQSAPVELLAGSAATVTLGLPVVRTSVGHGTAFDIAWRGDAKPEAMMSALSLTQRLVRS